MDEELGPNCMLDLHDCITYEEEVEKKIEVQHIQERSDEPYEESKEDHPLVLMNPPHASRILVKFKMVMEQKGHLKIVYGVDNYVFDVQDNVDTYVLGFQDELKNMNEESGVECSNLDASDVLRFAFLEVSRDTIYARFETCRASIFVSNESRGHIYFERQKSERVQVNVLNSCLHEEMLSAPTDTRMRVTTQAR
ncbi:hypothetical protein Syun_031076 [Stephania yunnanensis]|uniref:Uncharacterized protein n=1 Tax=Stephania yunnanensis TaxID=152371 RepID=A0AAP0HCT1_9MAGN